MKRISRKKWMAENIIFVDGLPGCGKTLLSPIIATLDRVELLSYAYEIEHYCQLSYLGKIDNDAAEALIRMQSDLKLYNTMMGRDVNFRPSDLSSVFKDHDPNRYLKRIFESGDSEIPDKIYAEKPILNLAVHSLLAFSEPLWRALENRCVFIEVVRHPLYMVRQQVLNFQKLIGNARHFTVYFSYKDCELPFFVKGWEDTYLKSTPEERVIYYISHLTALTDRFRKEMQLKYQARILTVPFESFVLDPMPWLKKISDLVGAEITPATHKVLSEQNVPRKKIADGIDLDIYRRCGWSPPLDGASERDELIIRRKDMARNINPEALRLLDALCEEYENFYWNP